MFFFLNYKYILFLYQLDEFLKIYFLVSTEMGIVYNLRDLKRFLMISNFKVFTLKYFKTALLIKSNVNFI